MNALLSLFLSFAMLFTGGTLPETADVAATLAVQDFILEYNGESYPLGFDFAVTAAAAQDEITLHFETVNGEGETMLPISGQIAEDGVTFAISESGKAYHMDAATLTAELGMDEEDTAVFEFIAGYMGEYAGMLTSMKDMQSAVSVETQTKLMDILYSHMDGMTSEELSWDFGSGEIPARHVTGKLSLMDTYAAMDDWMAMGDDVVSPMLSNMLEMYNMLFSMTGVTAAEIETAAEIAASTDAASIAVIGGADGPTAIYVAGAENEYVPVESFTQLIEMLSGEDGILSSQLEQTEMEMDIISAVEDDTQYQLANLYMILDEELGVSLNVNAESAASEASTVSYCNVYVDAPDFSMGVEVQMGVEGSIANPDSVNLAMMIQANSIASSFEVDDMDPDAEQDEVTEYVTNTAVITASTVYNDGLQDTVISMEMNESSTRYVNGEFVEEYEGDVASFGLSVDEESDEAGNVLSAIEMNAVSAEDETIGVSFNTVLSKAPAADYFAGREMIELNPDSEEAAMSALEIDAMALMSDAMAIAANEEFMALTGLMTGTAEEEAEEEEVTYLEFESLEQASYFYNGTVPAYTAPEGYSLQSVGAYSDGSYVEAYYADESGVGFTLSLYSYGYVDENPTCIMQNGMLVQMNTPVFTLSAYDGLYYAADADLADGSLSFYFDEDLSFEQVSAILAGLNL